MAYPITIYFKAIYFTYAYTVSIVAKWCRISTIHSIKRFKVKTSFHESQAMAAYREAQSWFSALHLFSEFHQQQLRRSIVSYSTATSACGACGACRWLRAWQMIQESQVGRVAGCRLDADRSDKSDTGLSGEIVKNRAVHQQLKSHL